MIYLDLVNLLLYQYVFWMLARRKYFFIPHIWQQSSVYIFAMAYSDVQHPHDYPLAVDADASEPVMHHVKYSNFSKAARNRDAYSQHLSWISHTDM